MHQNLSDAERIVNKDPLAPFRGNKIVNRQIVNYIGAYNKLQRPNRHFPCCDSAFLLLQTDEAVALRQHLLWHSALHQLLDYHQQGNGNEALRWHS